MTAGEVLRFPTGATLHRRRDDARAACSRPIPAGAVLADEQDRTPLCQPCQRAGTPSTREAPEVADATIRLIRRLGDRAARNVEDLRELVRVRDAVEWALIDGVAGARDRGYSYADVGRVMGTTRQAAQQRYGKAPQTVGRRP